MKDVLNEIKERLIENPEKLIELLENFGFEHINHRVNEIRCARGPSVHPHQSETAYQLRSRLLVNFPCRSPHRLP